MTTTTTSNKINNNNSNDNIIVAGATSTAIVKSTNNINSNKEHGFNNDFLSIAPTGYDNAASTNNTIILNETVMKDDDTINSSTVRRSVPMDSVYESSKFATMDPLINNNNSKSPRLDSTTGSMVMMSSQPPQRPMTAYNLFFMLERQRILTEYNTGLIFGDDMELYLMTVTLTRRPYSVNDIVNFLKQQYNKTNDDDNDDDDSTTRTVHGPKQKRRKRHYNSTIDFRLLSQLVAKRWRCCCTDVERQLFHDYYNHEMIQYRKIYSIYVQQQQKKETIRNEHEEIPSTSQFDKYPTENNESEGCYYQSTRLKTDVSTRTDEDDAIQIELYDSNSDDATATRSGHQNENNKRKNYDDRATLSTSDIMHHPNNINVDSTSTTSNGVALLETSNAAPINVSSISVDARSSFRSDVVGTNDLNHNVEEDNDTLSTTFGRALHFDLELVHQEHGYDATPPPEDFDIVIDTIGYENHVGNTEYRRLYLNPVVASMINNDVNLQSRIIYFNLQRDNRRMLRRINGGDAEAAEGHWEELPEEEGVERIFNSLSTALLQVRRRQVVGQQQQQVNAQH